MKSNDTSSLDLAENSAPARDARGRLRPGHGMGRPRGSRNRAGRAEIERLRQRGPAAWDVIDRRLSEGCVKSALFVLNRLVPAERTVEIEPTADEIADALATGGITVNEAQRAAAAMSALVDSTELRALKERLDMLETILNARADGRLCRS